MTRRVPGGPAWRPVARPGRPILVESAPRRDRLGSGPTRSRPETGPTRIARPPWGARACLRQIAQAEAGGGFTPAGRSRCGPAVRRVERI